MKPFAHLSLLLAALVLPLLLQAQAPDPAIQQVQVDVVYLSSDLLEGREAGTIGEQMAASYIASRFAEIGGRLY